MIDLRSDTVTRPTRAMYEAMRAAPVGDDVLGDDPTVRALEERAAAMAGKEAGLFLPSGTMANQIAVRLHASPGEAAIVERGCHLFNYENGGAAALSGVHCVPLQGEAGVLDPEQVRLAIAPEDVHVAPTRLVCVEDTANAGGGTVWPLARLRGVAEVAAAHGLGAHCDGARAFNAVVASGVPLHERLHGYHTASLCLSKGLGAPIGSVLVGPAAWMGRARRYRKLFGGGMRQAGVIAAAGLYALDHHVARLAEDHARARALAARLRALGWSVAEPATNMVYVDCPDPGAVQAALAAQGVLALGLGRARLRMVLHLDVDDAAVEAAAAAFATIPLPRAS